MSGTYKTNTASHWVVPMITLKNSNNSTQVTGTLHTTVTFLGQVAMSSFNRS